CLVGGRPDRSCVPPDASGPGPATRTSHTARGAAPGDRAYPDRGGRGREAPPAGRVQPIRPATRCRSQTPGAGPRRGRSPVPRRRAIRRGTSSAAHPGGGPEGGAPAHEGGRPEPGGQGREPGEEPNLGAGRRQAGPCAVTWCGGRVRGRGREGDGGDGALLRRVGGHLPADLEEDVEGRLARRDVRPVARRRLERELVAQRDRDLFPLGEPLL